MGQVNKHLPSFSGARGAFVVSSSCHDDYQRRDLFTLAASSLERARFSRGLICILLTHPTTSMYRAEEVAELFAARRSQRQSVPMTQFRRDGQRLAQGVLADMPQNSGSEDLEHGDVVAVVQNAFYSREVQRVISLAQGPEELAEVHPAVGVGVLVDDLVST